jgi:NAD(P)-dependent dehydrogenase (short-subunit alcohol dehydrogenase family)
MKDISGKTAFVTGGASGIGLGTVRALLERGARVVVADIRQDHLDQTAADLAGQPVHFIKLDIADRDAWGRAADEAEAVFGPVDILANIAGVGVLGGVKTATYADIDWSMSVNVGGTVNGIMTFLPRMLARGKPAHIVNTTSLAGIMPFPHGFAYTAAKFAVVGVTEGLRADVAGDPIGVTLLIPGPVKSNINEIAKLRPSAFAQTNSAEFEAEMLERKPLDTWMEPIDAGRLVTDAIARDLPFVITHGQFRGIVEQYFDALLWSFGDKRPDAPKVDLGFEFDNPVYREFLARGEAPARADAP